MPRKGRMFPGVTRQVVIADETHQWLCDIARKENKYIGELADELLRHALATRHRRSPRSNGTRTRPRKPSTALLQ